MLTLAPQVCSSHRQRSFNIAPIRRLALSGSGPHSGESATSIERFARRLAATSRGPDASPFAHQAVHSPPTVGILAPTLFSMSKMASVIVVRRSAGCNPSLFHAATYLGSGGHG